MVCSSQDTIGLSECTMHMCIVEEFDKAQIPPHFPRGTPLSSVCANASLKQSASFLPMEVGVDHVVLGSSHRSDKCRGSYLCTSLDSGSTATHEQLQGGGGVAD